jgi:hypothetical protein
MDKIYWRQNVSAAKCIDGKTYRWQNILAAKHIGDKPKMWQKYQWQNISVAKCICSKHISYKVARELKTGFPKPLGSCKQVF